jgi:hypothetical protein
MIARDPQWLEPLIAPRARAWTFPRIAEERLSRPVRQIGPSDLKSKKSNFLSSGK